ncbi:helix-turn-helix domain-containing protein [Streptomyces sp. NBC_01335]|uniref:helix-turn-helix domain-containing protein n=1 Tax=Streptomyces sp. NBC_01335 TaxID=2903828 RepID=UPI003FA343E9
MTNRARDTSPYEPGPYEPSPYERGPYDDRQARGAGRGLTRGARVIPLRPVPATPASGAPASAPPAPRTPASAAPREPLLRDLVGEVLRQERLSQERTLKDVADSARISFAYLSELERGRKEASSEVLASAAHALGLGLADVLGRAASELARRSAFRAAARATGLVPSRSIPRAQVRLAA